MLEKDFQIIQIDVHGQGRSGIRIPLILEEMAGDCHELLARLGLSKPVWVCHSIGGMLGMRMAYKYPEAYAALVLIATTARLDPQPLRDQTWQLWQAFRAGQRATIAEPTLPFFFAKATFREQPELVRGYRNWIINFLVVCFHHRPGDYRVEMITANQPAAQQLNILARNKACWEKAVDASRNMNR